MLTPIQPAPGRWARPLLAARDAAVGSTRTRPLLIDGVLAAVVLVLSLPPFTSLSGGDPPLALVLVLAMVIPLAWRRRGPFTVLLVITVPAIVQLSTDRQVTDFLAFLIMFYTICVCSRPRLVLIAALLLGTGIALGVARACRLRWCRWVGVSGAGVGLGRKAAVAAAHLAGPAG